MKKTVIVILLLAAALSATGFGRNKVQVEMEDWWEIRARHFTIFFPQGGEVPAESLLVHTERELLELSERFNYMPEEPIPIILYISPGTFRQTNINPYEITQAVGGFTEFYKGRVVIPFTGYWSDFRHVVEHELNHAYIFDMLYRRSLLNIVTGGTPLWMMEGLAEYTSLGWDRESEAEFRDMVISNQIVPIAELSRRRDYLVYREGQAIYHFIMERYGEQKFNDFVRHLNSRAGKPGDTSTRGDGSGSGGGTLGSRGGDPFNAVFGMTADQFSEKFIEWARETYWSELACGESPADIANALYYDDKRVSQINTIISANGDLIAGLEYHHAHFAVTVRSAVTGEVIDRPLVAGGLSDIQLSPMYRICSFSPSTDSMVVAAQYISGDRLVICSDGDSWDLPVEMDLIREPVWSPDGRYIAFSGMMDGTLDVYLWDLQQRELNQLTDNVRGERDLSWAGDRLLCTAEGSEDSTSILMYDLEGGVQELYSNSSSLRYPIDIPEGVLFLSNMEGYPDLYLLNWEDGGLSRITTLYRTIDSPSWADSSGILSFVSSDWNGNGVFMARNIAQRRVVECTRGCYCIEHEELRSDTPVERERDVQPIAGREEPSTEERPSAGGPPSEGGERPPAEHPAHSPATAMVECDFGDPEGQFQCSIAPYSPRLTVDYVSAMASYDSYLGVAGYTQIILSDMLAHHQVAVNTNLNGGSLSDVDLALFYGYLPRRTDYIFGLLRESYRYLFRFDDGHYEEVRDVDMGGFAQMIYPFSPSLRFGLSLDYRRLTRNGTWNSTADFDEDIVSVRGSAVFDNALWGSVGPRVGSRLSLVGEFAPSISGSAQFGTVLFDLRNYLWVSNRVTLATRLAGGTSWGEDGQNFFLGGAIPHRLLWGEVDNIEELLGFYTNYGDMLRGYDYASLQGRRYAVLTNEFRVPFVNTLALDAPLPLVVRNGRGVFFFDLGTAFNDLSSFRGASTDGGFHLQDLKMGVGLGYRFNLGYFLVKHDISWRTDLRGISRKPVQNFTIGAEF